VKRYFFIVGEGFPLPKKTDKKKILKVTLKHGRGGIAPPVLKIF